jgi:hypothetical protein
MVEVWARAVEMVEVWAKAVEKAHPERILPFHQACTLPHPERIPPFRQACTLHFHRLEHNNRFHIPT